MLLVSGAHAIVAAAPAPVVVVNGGALSPLQCMDGAAQGFMVLLPFV